MYVLQVCAADIAQTKDGGEGKDDTINSPNGHNSLEAAFGAGKGKHAGKKRRRHSNKYSSQSKTAEIDPWEEQMQQADKTLGEAEARARKELEELEERRDQRRLERGEVDYPDEEDIDPYDPSTFGYIEVKTHPLQLSSCLVLYDGIMLSVIPRTSYDSCIICELLVRNHYLRRARFFPEKS